MRPRKVFLIYTSHTDPGWHDLPARVMEQHATYLDAVIEFCEQTRDLPLSQRFVFTAESTWTIDYYERHRPRARFERLMECCRRGQFEITALYAGVHSDLCGHEELARLSWYATDLRRRYGVPVSTAMLNDVSEGYTKGLPQVLARSGIVGILFGPGVKAVAKGIAPDLPRLFRWQTPDGSSVLVGWTPGFWTYTSWSEAGFRGAETLDQFEQLGDAYPYDAIFRHVGNGDNDPPSLDVFQRFQDYLQLPDLQIRLARIDEFFSYIETHFADTLPVYQGDNPQSWADGTLSLAHETALHRAAQRTAIQAETLATLAALRNTGLTYPREAFVELYRNLHLYSDHTWGLDLETGVEAGSRLGRAVSQGRYEEVDSSLAQELDVDSPVFDEWRKNWDAKKVYAHEALQLASSVRQQAQGQLASLLSLPGPSIVVWNTASWVRSDLVRLPWTGFTEDRFALIDGRDQQELPWQLEPAEDGSVQLVFLAKELPPLGPVCYTIEARPARVPHGVARASSEATIENRFYRLELDPQHGTVKSIWDKELQRELVDQQARYGFNQYIHADVTVGYEGVGTKEKAGMAHGEGTRYVPEQIETVVCRRGSVFSTLQVRTRLTQGPAPAALEQAILLPEEERWIEIHNRVEKKASLSKEQVYFAFPFALAAPFQTKIELPYAVLDWERDILPGCWRGYTSTQHWVTLSNQEMNITWSSLDAPVLCVGEITSNQWDPQWHRTYVPTQGHLYSYIMSNIWNCNYALWQGGAMSFQYRLTSAAGPCDKAAATRFGWGNATPLLANVFPSARQGTQPTQPVSALTLDVENVLVSVLKRADDGQGWIVRLYETAGQPTTTCRINVSFFSPQTVYQTTLAEENIQPVALEQGQITISLRAHELVTLRLQ